MNFSTPSTGTRRPRAKPVSTLAQCYTVAEVANYLGCSPSTVWRRIAESRLKAMRDGRLVRVTAEDLQAYLRANRVVR